MKPAFSFFLFFLVGASALAQAPSSVPAAAKPVARAAIAGIVTREPGSEPVKKTLIELIAENQAEGGDYAAVSAADGSFHIEGIVPGRYHLFAERTGFLEVEKHHARGEGRMLTLAAGQEVKDLVIRLEAAAVVRGRVTDQDGDPMPNVQVSVLRQTYTSGRSRWEQAGSERTNDLGEYRIPNLPAGNYYVCVSPPPDFKSLIESAGIARYHVDAEGALADHAPGTAGNEAEKAAATSYHSTYYPGTTDRSQAAPIQLKAGDDFPVDFSLTPSPSLSIRGSVANLPPRSSAAIMLQSRDFGMVLSGAEVHRDGTFVIRDVEPGAYTILASAENAPVRMMASQSLQIVANGVEDLRLSLQPGASIRGRLRLESKDNLARFDPTQMFLVLHPVDGEDGVVEFGIDGFSQITHVAIDGSFEWKNVPPDRYYIQLAGGPDGNLKDWYLKSVLANGRDADEAGISINGGVVLLDLVASANAGAVDGVVTDSKGQPVANAVVVSVPEVRWRARPDHYRKTVSDQSGHFLLSGVPPGDYALFAWDEVEGDEYYNPDFLKRSESQQKSTALHANPGEQKSVSLQVIPETQEQQ